MKKILTFLFVVYLIGLPQGALGNEQPTPVPFKVEISLDEASLKTDFYKKAHRLYIHTRVTNVSDKAQNITVWTQQGWSWVSNNPNISPGTEAMKNFPTNIILKPGESFKGKVETFATPAPKPTTFRFGFYPKAELPVSDQPGMEKSADIIWSNAVTLTE